jgi:hypothetical protein
MVLRETWTESSSARELDHIRLQKRDSLHDVAIGAKDLIHKKMGQMER